MAKSKRGLTWQLTPAKALESTFPPSTKAMAAHIVSQEMIYDWAEWGHDLLDNFKHRGGDNVAADDSRKGT